MVETQAQVSPVYTPPVEPPPTEMEQTQLDLAQAELARIQQEQQVVSAQATVVAEAMATKAVSGIGQVNTDTGAVITAQDLIPMTLNDPAFQAAPPQVQLAWIQAIQAKIAEMQAAPQAQPAAPSASPTPTAAAGVKPSYQQTPAPSGPYSVPYQYQAAKPSWQY
jgi:hypothetical protein